MCTEMARTPILGLMMFVGLIAGLVSFLVLVVVGEWVGLLGAIEVSVAAVISVVIGLAVARVRRSRTRSPVTHA